MSYQVLYRRFRPQKFSEIYGQEQVTDILKNQIKTGNISHAYLFCGPRGTGKTSAAKVFARAVNCENNNNGEPCMECDNCTKQTGASILNTIEIDAASNRGIDEIRQLKDNIGFIPVSGKYKVYIIDEIHMLTTEAFNALLKTLEEPPEHVIFIFATTEIYKVLPTILSRCQRFDFKRISDNVIIDKLSVILKEMNIKAQKEALSVIASASDGSLRDALSLTDKLLNSSDENNLTAEGVRSVLGFTDEEEIFALAQAISDENAGSALEILDNAVNSGADTEHIIASLTEYFRSLLIYTSTSKYEQLLRKSESYYESLKRNSAYLTPQLISGYITQLSKIRSEGRIISNTRTLFEASILKMCDKDRFIENFTLAARIDKLESRIEALIKKAPELRPTNNNMDVPFTSDTVTSSNETKTKTDNLINTQNVTIDDSAHNKAVLSKMKEEINFASKYVFNSERDIMLSDIFGDLQPKSFDGETLYVYPTKSSVFLMDAFKEKNGAQKLSELLSKNTDSPIKVVLCTPNEKEENNKPNIETAKEILGELTELSE